jgi:hypothetical protein
LRPPTPLMHATPDARATALPLLQLPSLLPKPLLQSILKPSSYPASATLSVYIRLPDGFARAMCLSLISFTIPYSELLHQSPATALHPNWPDVIAGYLFSALHMNFMSFLYWDPLAASTQLSRELDVLVDTICATQHTPAIKFASRFYPRRRLGSSHLLSALSSAHYKGVDLDYTLHLIGPAWSILQTIAHQVQPMAMPDAAVVPTAPAPTLAPDIDLFTDIDDDDATAVWSTPRAPAAAKDAEAVDSFAASDVADPGLPLLPAAHVEDAVFMCESMLQVIGLSAQAARNVTGVQGVRTLATLSLLTDAELSTTAKSLAIPPSRVVPISWLAAASTPHRRPQHGVQLDLIIENNLKLLAYYL